VTSPTVSDSDLHGNGDFGSQEGFVERMGVGSNHSFNGIGDELTQAAGSSVAISAATSSQPFMLMSTSAANSGNSAGWLGQQIYYAGREPAVTFGVAYPSNADYSSTTHIWFGLVASNCPAASMAASDTPACSFAAIRHSTAAGDATYQCVTGNGKLTTANPIAVAPTTAFTRMRIEIGPNSVTCTVGAVTATNTTTLPASATVLQDLFLNTAKVAAPSHLELNGVYGVSKNGAF
jgi:hypothetical protein